MCICKNKICIWSDPGVNLPICKYTPVSICVRMRHLLTPSKICTMEYIYTRVLLVHANWTKDVGQLCSHFTADLRLCFRICTLLVFLCGGSNELKNKLKKSQYTNIILKCMTSTERTCFGLIKNQNRFYCVSVYCSQLSPLIGYDFISLEAVFSMCK